jgi:hypothetical protein
MRYTTLILSGTGQGLALSRIKRSTRPCIARPRQLEWAEIQSSTREGELLDWG